MKPAHFNDPLEIAVAEILDKAGIRYIHESQNNGSRLDFYLPDHDLYIEVKKYHTPRVDSQLATKDNIILIQGANGVRFLRDMFKVNLYKDYTFYLEKHGVATLLMAEPPLFPNGGNPVMKTPDRCPVYLRHHTELLHGYFNGEIQMGKKYKFDGSKYIETK